MGSLDECLQTLLEQLHDDALRGREAHHRPGSFLVHALVLRQARPQLGDLGTSGRASASRRARPPLMVPERLAPVGLLCRSNSSSSISLEELKSGGWTGCGCVALAGRLGPDLCELGRRYRADSSTCRLKATIELLGYRR